MRNTRVSGHGLHKEGKPYRIDLCVECAVRDEDPEDRGVWRDEFGRRSRSIDGHGLCSCGALSPHMYADRARKQWHLSHKSEVVRAVQ